jgi:hypothetical protein
VNKLLILLLPAFAGCSSEPGWRPAAAEAASGLAAQRATAEGARDALASRLMAELTAALAKGPKAAIEVCSARAPAIAAEVGAERAVRVGRTSSRLRNTGNQAPAWAAGHVASTAVDPAFFVGPDRQLGALFPIRLLPQCVQCHGSQEQLAPDVRNALSERYPQDRATGFAAGDLRGWFWVEVPASR